MVSLILAILILLLALWLLGFGANLAWWINVVLVIAVVGLVFNLLIVPILRTRGWDFFGLWPTQRRRTGGYRDEELPVYRHSHVHRDRTIRRQQIARHDRGRHAHVHEDVEEEETEEHPVDHDEVA